MGLGQVTKTCNRCELEFPAQFKIFDFHPGWRTLTVPTIVEPSPRLCPRCGVQVDVATACIAFEVSKRIQLDVLYRDVLCVLYCGETCWTAARVEAAMRRDPRVQFIVYPATPGDP